MRERKPSEPRTQRCPTCERDVAPPEENPAHPFCSGRCKLIDLGNWLSESYRVAGPPAWPEDDDGGPGRLPS